MASAPRKRMTWPPKDVKIETIGEIKDTRSNCSNCPRDIGRSVKFGGHLWYLWGDAYHFDRKGEFCGAANNSIAYIPDPSDPCKSHYQSKENCVPLFIPHTKEEEEFEAKHKDENWRRCKWPFGGLVEDSPGSGTGYVFFDILETHGGMEAENFGVRAARVTLQQGGGESGKTSLKDRLGFHNRHSSHGSEPTVKVERSLPDERIFPKEWPQFGHKAAVLSGDYVYLLAGVEANNFMARYKQGSDPTKRSSYEYWTKQDWQNDLANVDDLAPILNEFGQGEILNMPNCGIGGASLMMLACNRFGDGNLQIGWAHSMTGPWTIESVGKVPCFFNKEAMRYAMYPHTWAADWNKGELVFSWSDAGQQGSAVIAGKLSFAVEDPQ